MPLYTYLYTSNLTTPVQVANVTSRFSDLSFQWKIHGGIVSISAKWGGNYASAYDFYQKYIGYRLVVVDHNIDIPVAEGFISELTLGNTGVSIVAQGFWWRHYDQMYAFDETVKASGTTTKKANDNTDSNLAFNPVANSFQDKETNFTTYSVASQPALYKITVYNTDNSTVSGYIGNKFTTTNANDSIYVYREASLTTPGWNNTPGTANSYYIEIITSDLVYNPVANSFKDPVQDFSSFATAVQPAVYKIEVLNDNNTYSWGFIGDSFTTTNADDSVYVYQDYELTTPGWLLEPTSGRSPRNYTVMLTYSYYTTSEIIEDALTLEVPAVASDYSHIGDTGTPVGFWAPPIEDSGGMYPGELIEKLASFSDSNNTQWNYWLVSQKLNGLQPQKPIAYFQAQLNDGTFDYNIYRWMLSSNSDVGTRNIQEMRNSVMAIYRNLEDGEPAIAPELGPLEDATSIAKYWRREAIVSAGDADDEIALTYVGLYLDKFKDALLGKAITITAPYILDNNGARVPLWFPIKFGKSYFRLADVYPDAISFTITSNRLFSGQAIEMQYTYSSNQLQLTLDTESNELDALIARMDGFK